MPSYTLQWSNPNKGTITINPLTVDTSSTSLSLVGQGLSSYGQYEQQNFIRLLENFASTTAPANPTVGQFWFNTTTNAPMVYSTGNTWVNVGGAVISTTVPSNPNPGNTWFNTTNNSLYVYNGAAWERVLTVSSKVAAGIEAATTIQTDLNNAPLGLSHFNKTVTACANSPSINGGIVNSFSVDGTNVPNVSTTIYQIVYPADGSTRMPYYRKNVSNGGWSAWLQCASVEDLTAAVGGLASTAYVDGINSSIRNDFGNWNTSLQNQINSTNTTVSNIPIQYCYWSGQIGTMPFYYPGGSVAAGGCQGGINLRANFGVGTYKIVDNHYGTVFFIIVGDGYTEMVNNTNGLIQNSFFLFGGNDRVVSSGATYTTYASLQYTTYYSGNSISIYKLNISADMNNLAQLVGGAGLTGSSSISTLNDRVAALEAWQQTVISGGNSGG